MRLPLRSLPPAPVPAAYGKPLRASLDGFTLHAATRAGALHTAGREAQLRYVLRPPCLGRRMNATAANVIERVLPPQSRLRQWAWTFPLSWWRLLSTQPRLSTAFGTRVTSPCLQKPLCSIDRY